MHLTAHARGSTFAAGHANPTAGDALSVIEVGSATSYQNKKAKLSIYASAGVPEVILFDIQDKAAITVTVYRTPVNVDTLRHWRM